MTQDLDMIYLFGFSGRMGIYLDNLLRIVKVQIENGSKIGIIFIHDGVIGTSSNGKIPKSLLELMDLGVNLYVMIPDLKARGINYKNVHEKIIAIEYEGLVDIIETTPKIISWM